MRFDPSTNSPPSPFMYEPDVEEDEPAVGCDHGFPDECDVEDGDE